MAFGLLESLGQKLYGELNSLEQQRSVVLILMNT